MNEQLLREALGYRRYTGSTRVLVLDTGYLMVRDVVDAAHDLGWHVHSLPTRKEGRGSGEFVGQLLLAAATHKPDFILTINHLGFDEAGVLARLLRKFDLPTASWFVDHPLPVLGGSPGNVSATCQVFCFERAALPWLREQGYEDPVFLPTASNRRYFHPSAVRRGRSEELAWPLTFVGNSWWTKARLEPPPWVIKGVEDLQQIHSLDRHSINQGLEESLAQLELPAGQQRACYLVAATAMAEASVERRGRLARALQPLDIRIHGDPAWQELAPGVRQGPPLDYATELPSLFAGCQVNANVTAEQMPTAVNPRVWDVPATGAFILTDAQEDALEFFEEDREVVVYRDFEEAADKARYYLDHDAEREAIAGAAHEKVERSHRFTHRLKMMAEVMRDRFG